MRDVKTLRLRVSKSAELTSALHAIKKIQAQRFANTYQDLLRSQAHKDCAEFFLSELYGERDYSKRDEQFAKVAGTIELALPEAVISTTVSLATLHHVTETLDIAMAEHWAHNRSLPGPIRYLHAWRELNCTAQRRWQLETVIVIGQKLGELTRQRGLRLMLKLMRHPAEIAGLTELQAFLETGFDRFLQLAKVKETLSEFLETIQTRESSWINTLDSIDEFEGEVLLTKMLQTSHKQKRPIE